MSDALRPRRVVFYSHDTVGLGHVRRNIALAAALVRTDIPTDVLLITGNPEAAALPRPANTDIVTVPTVAKDSSGGYCSRSLRLALNHVLDMRGAVIEAAVLSFRPDLLVVDKVPLGVGRELLGTLNMLRDDPQRRTSVVLGLREILDDPVTAIRDWIRSQSTRVIEDYYDAVWVYGDRRVYDPIVEYGLPSQVASKVSYTGYLVDDRDVGSARPHRGPPGSSTTAAGAALSALHGGWRPGRVRAVPRLRPDGPAGRVPRSRDLRAVHASGRAAAGPCRRRSTSGHDRATTSSRPSSPSSTARPRWSRWRDTTAPARSSPPVDARCWCRGPGRGWSSGSVPNAWPSWGWSTCCPPTSWVAERLAQWLSAAVAEPAATTAREARAAIDTGGLHRVPELAAELIARRAAERLSHAAA